MAAEQAARALAPLGTVKGYGLDLSDVDAIAPAVAQQVRTDSPAPQEQPDQQDTQSQQAAETAAGQATPK